ncbi:murein transglycosylase A [Nitratireductor luteus]|uniref:murein transglycosylase A n=1 Tax=Nitratireductor luteus TaxID=2976980 RepID=UPI00223F55D7|nr:murein transglycosylase A [Nitratireductor luteus]
MRPTAFADIPGWISDDLVAAFAAFRRSAEYARTVKPYRTGSLGISAASFDEAFEAALSAGEDVGPTDARAFFERFFSPYRVLPDSGAPGFVTGYYEPEAEASLVRTERFQVPIYGRPLDLLEISPDDPPSGIELGYAFARREGERLIPYFDRRAIDTGALEGRGLELFWLADRVDAFFIHVQGAARLHVPDGRVRRITYAGKTGHPFTGIGRVLAELGEIPLRQVTMQSIRAWLAANPDRMDEIFWRNRSYVFFRETEPGEARLGPVAAAKVQLTPGRSMAVDRLLHTFATPFFVHAPTLDAERSPFQRLMIAQDTGSAITGPARGDLFMGTGKDAGETAGVIRHPADFHMLAPRALDGLRG